MQLQGTKISNKGQQVQQKQKHPKQQQQAEKSTRQQQSSACTMGHGNPEEAPESFARPRANTVLKSTQKHHRSRQNPSKAYIDQPRPAKTSTKNKSAQESTQIFFKPKYQTAAEQCMHNGPWKPRGSTRELRSLASLAHFARPRPNTTLKSAQKQNLAKLSKT